MPHGFHCERLPQLRNRLGMAAGITYNGLEFLNVGLGSVSSTNAATKIDYRDLFAKWMANTSTEGILAVICIISEPERILALSFWQREEDAERYHREQFPTITQMVQPLLETTPMVQQFNVDTSTTHHIVKGKAA